MDGAKKNVSSIFFAGVLLLSLSANLVMRASENVVNVINDQIDLEREKLAFDKGKFYTSLVLTMASPFIIQALNQVLIERIKDWYRKPKIIIRSSKDNSEKLDQKMVFSDELRLKLDGLVAITKKINEQRKSNSAVKYRNVLFHGPPGTGKTMFAEKLARKLHSNCGMEWVMVTGSGFFQKGAYVEGVNDIFINEVKNNKKKGTIIIIDEADSLFVPRENLDPCSEGYRVINQILSFLGERTDDRMVIMTSNHLVLDSAMERRIDDAVKVPLPGNKERVETLRLYKRSFALANLTGEKIKEIAANTEGFSQSDLSGILDKLKMKSDIDGDTNIEGNADTIVKEYCEKKQLFAEQQPNKDRDRLEELKRKGYGAAAG